MLVAATPDDHRDDRDDDHERDQHREHERPPGQRRARRPAPLARRPARAHHRASIARPGAIDAQRRWLNAARSGQPGLVRVVVTGADRERRGPPC
jgi:hypothetical protein